MGGNQMSLFANSDMKTGNREVKNPRLKVGSSVRAEGSQRDSIEYEENEALKEPSFRDSTQIHEQKNSQTKVGSMRNMRPTKKKPFNHKRKF